MPVVGVEEEGVACIQGGVILGMLVIGYCYLPLWPCYIDGHSSRESALARIRVALNEIVIEGINSNVDLQKDIITDCAFIEGGTDIHYLEKKLGL